MPKIIANDEAFECKLHDKVAIFQLKKNAMKITIELESRDKYLNWD